MSRGVDQKRFTVLLAFFQDTPPRCVEDSHQLNLKDASIAPMEKSIQGQMLRRSARREVAIYLHGSALWVADFIDGDGQIVDAATWIRFNCGSVSTYYARRRMIRESALPVSRELSVRIEQLHQARAVHGGVGSAGQGANALSARLGRVLGIIFRRRLRDSAQPSSRKDRA